MQIHRPEIVHDQGQAILRAEVQYAGNTEHLWYSVGLDWGEYLTSERCDAFVVALLPVAMSVGEDVYVGGIMSERLYYNLGSYYIPILKTIVPTLKHVRIVPEQISSDRLPREHAGVATGFSGGIDSFCVLADHLYANVPDAFRVSHLLFNNVGSHGRGKGARNLCDDRFRRLLPATQAIDLPFIKIDSNLDDLFPDHLDFQLTHTARNVSAALTMQKLIARYLYASGFKYQDCYIGETYDMAYTDPATVHLLSTETTECISTGSQYSRVEKTGRICEIELTRQFLDVCVMPSGHRNCSTCWKCARTLLTLDVLGKLHLYDRVFDLARYGQIKYAYVGKVILSKDPLLREIRQLAQERGYRFPRAACVCHMKNVLLAMVHSVVSKVVRKVCLASLYTRLRRRV